MKIKQAGQWKSIGGLSLFRGEWGPDELIKQYDFSLATFPDEFSIEVNGASNPRVVSRFPSDSLEGDPGYPYCAQLNSNNYNVADYARLVLNLSQFSNVTRLAFWFANITGGSKQTTVRINGEVIMTWNEVKEWTEYSVSVSNSDIIAWEDGGNYGNNYSVVGQYAAVTGVRLYSQASPYMLGEFVTHNGMMWKSLTDNNSDEPGVNGRWVKVLELPRPFGTTAERPEPVTAGTGYEFFDTDLGKPIWSNGASWVDSTGTVLI